MLHLFTLQRTIFKTIDHTHDIELATHCAVRAVCIAVRQSSQFLQWQRKGIAQTNSHLSPPEQLQWIDRLITAWTEPFQGQDNLGVDNSGKDTSTSVPGSLPVPLVTPVAGSLVSTLTLTNTLVTPVSQGGE